MNDMIKFKENLDAILEVSKAQNNTMSISEIKGYFEDSDLTDDQFVLIYDYLTANHITIENYEKRGVNMFETNHETVGQQEEVRTIKGSEDNGILQLKGKLSKKEQEYIEHYRREVHLLNPHVSADLEKVLQDAISGIEEAKKELLDAHLQLVADIVTEFCGRGVSASDLIQEGNMGLMSAVDEIINGKELIDAQAAGAIIRDRIRESMHLALNEDYISKEQEQIMLHKVNKINDAAKHIAEEHVRLATIQEIAEYTRIPEDEIANIIKLSKEDLGVKHEHKH